jgi:hypothetical protein
LAEKALRRARDALEQLRPRNPAARTLRDLH